MSSSRDFKIITRNDRRILRDMLPLDKPLSIFLEPTNICNFRCAPCVHGQEETRKDLKPFKHMDMELYNKIIREIKAWDGARLRLLRLAVLGEPFLHPHMLEMIKIAKEADIAERVDTFSNGSVLSEDMCTKIIEYELDYIRFSIYSVLNNKHREVTKSNCDVNLIHRNISTLKKIRDAQRKSKPFILVKMFDTYTEENDVFFRMYKDIGDEVALEKVHDATKYSGQNLIKSYYKDEKIEKLIASDYEKSLHSHTVCPRPFMAMVINSTGDILMCTHDAPKATKVGNANDRKLEEIWRGRELFEFRKMHLSGNTQKNYLCRNCDWFKLFPEEDNVDGFPISGLIPEGVDWG